MVYAIKPVPASHTTDRACVCEVYEYSVVLSGEMLPAYWHYLPTWRTRVFLYISAYPERS
jgi:hypothetical protein